MPVYAGTGLAKLLNTNTQKYAWSSEVIPAGAAAPASASLAFQLERQKSAFYPNGASAELTFAGAPGAFEVDIQTADTDSEIYYVTVATITAVNSNNAARWESTTIYAKFIRAYMKTLTNPVATTLKITR